MGFDAGTLLKLSGFFVALFGVVATGVAFADLAGREVDGERVADWVLLSSVAPVALVAVGGALLWALGEIVDRL